MIFLLLFNIQEISEGVESFNIHFSSLSLLFLSCHLSYSKKFLIFWDMNYLVEI